MRNKKDGEQMMDGTGASLTPKQQDILRYIQESSLKKGYAPSQQEIAKHFGFRSLGTVQNYLVRLERGGYLKKAWNARRGMQVLPQPQESSQDFNQSGSVPLPLVGAVAAGRPIEAIEQRETLDVPVSMLGRGEHVVLRVKGDSMIGDGILDGDFVVIRKQQMAMNGQTVVALVHNEATIKRFYHRGSRIELQAANPSYDPLIVDSMVENPDFKIEGVMVGLIRRLS